MANRKYSKMTKIQPSVQTFQFSVTQEDVNDLNYIDLSQCASILNRRFYRQGINWAVSSIKILTAATGAVGINKLPNTWVMSNSWEKVFRSWKRQQDEALDDGTQESIKAKFNDFKIYMDADHHQKGFASNLMPQSSGVPNPETATAGEWEPAQIVIPNYGTPGTNYEPFLHAVGGDVGGAGGSISMIKAYENSRSVPQSPDPLVPGTVLSSSNFLNLMFDVGDNNTDVLANVVGKNDELPYVQDNYPGGAVQAPTLQYHDSALISGTTIGGVTSLKGGNFPCGLIRVSSNIDQANTLFVVNLIPGNHRGYLCEPMTER